MKVNILLFPAHAGVILGKDCELIRMTPFPRACGGDPIWARFQYP